MQTFQKFYFKWYDFDTETLVANFHYSFDDIEHFTETIDFASEEFFVRDDIDDDIMDDMLFHTSIALGISYYKLYPTQVLVVESWYLTDEQIEFWQKFYKNGLWEFLYKNQISPEELFHFENVWESRENPRSEVTLAERALIPLWGGKDSLVTIETFQRNNFDFETVVFGKMDTIKTPMSEMIGVDNLLIKRKLSENLFTMNEAGYYNGHVPITGIIAFSLIIAAYLYDYKYIVLSNERSAESPNTIWNGFEINHQYSKSLEFEDDFRNYIGGSIATDVEYFSFLRWLYEVQITKLFSELCAKYFSVFSSCNNNFKISKKWNQDTLWCKKCPKCLFVYVMLSAFLSSDDLMKIFWSDLYQNESLEPTFRELLWLEWIKPFECVWEVEEVVLAMSRTIEKYGVEDIPYILQIFKTEVYDTMSDIEREKLEKKLFKIYRADNIPEWIYHLEKKLHE